MANLLLFIGGLGPIELFIFLIPFLIWGYAVVEIVTNDFKAPVDKVVWLLVVLLIPVLGVIFYYLLGRSKLAK